MVINHPPPFLAEEAFEEILRFAEERGETTPLIELRVEEDAVGPLKSIFLVPRAGCVLIGKTVFRDRGIDILVEGPVYLLAGKELHFERRSDVRHDPKLKNGGFFLRDNAETVRGRMNHGA